MFKIKGSVSGVFRDAKTGEITREFAEVHNHVQDWYLKDLWKPSTSINSLGTEIFVSPYNPGQQRRDMPQNFTFGTPRIGSDIVGVTDRELFLDDSPGVHLIQYTQRFGPPEEDYTINSVGLCTSLSGNRIDNLTNLVWLENPCIQTTTESLDLFYRVQILFETSYLQNTQDSRTLTPSESAIIARVFSDDSTEYPIDRSSNTNTTCGSLSISKINSRKYLRYVQSSATFGPNLLSMSNQIVERDAEFFKSWMTASNDLPDNIGIVTTHIGSSSTALYYKTVPENISPIQSIFGHRDTSTTPFYTAATAQLGLGNIIVNGDSWTNPDHPKYFKVDITQSGGLGVGEYKFRVCESYGFWGNTFSIVSTPLIWSMEENTPVTSDFSFIDTSELQMSSYPIFYNEQYLLFIKSNAIAKTEILTGDTIHINNSTLVGTDLSPRFLATAISQAETNTALDTFVACRNTGLYKFNEAFDTLEIINSSVPGLENTIGCFGVFVGMSDRVWAFFSHTAQNGLYYSDNNGASWTKTAFVSPDIDARVSNVLFIHADTNNHHVAIMYIASPSADLNTNGAERTLKWWDDSTQTVSDGPAFAFGQNYGTKNGYEFTPGDTYGYQRLVTCSPTSSIWATAANLTINSNVAKFEFGTTSKITVSQNLHTNSYFTNWYTDENGVDYCQYISTNAHGGTNTSNGYYSVLLNLLTYEYEAVPISSYRSELTNTWSMFPVNNRNLWLMNGTSFNEIQVLGLTPIIPHQQSVNDFPVHYEMAYPEFGWDGTTWVKGHPNGKPLHNTAEELVEGITVSFDDNNGNAPFFNIDHYTFGVVDGIWLDGFTTFEHYWELYSKPTQINTEVESPTLPAGTKVPNTLIPTIPSSIGFYQDFESTQADEPGTLKATGTGLTGDYNAGARTILPVIDSSISPFVPFAVFVPNTQIKNAQGYAEFAIFGVSSSTTAVNQYYTGLSSIDRLGTSLNFNTIKYAIHVDNQTPEALSMNDARYASVRVIENGIERAVLPIPVFIGTETTSKRFRIVLLNNGSIAYLIENETNFWLTIYQSPAGSVPVEDLYFDVNYVPQSNQGYTEISFYSLSNSNQDYYMYLGNGLDQGVYNPNFYAIDPSTVKLKINGIDAIMIGRDNSTSVLAANTYSVYPYEGVIRFSAADAGLPVSAEYVTLLDK